MRFRQNVALAPGLVKGGFGRGEGYGSMCDVRCLSQSSTAIPACPWQSSDPTGHGTAAKGVYFRPAFFLSLTHIQTLSLCTLLMKFLN